MKSYDAIGDEARTLKELLVEDNSGSVLRGILYGTLKLIEDLAHELKEDERATE